jgi:ATP-dependent DNA helicase DinG
LSSFPAVIFDEAHHVEDVAGLYFGLEFAGWTVTDLCRDVLRAMAQPKLSEAFRAEGAAACERISQCIKEVYKHLAASTATPAVRHRFDPAAMPPSFHQAMGQLRDALENLGRTLQGPPSSSALWDSLQTRCGTLVWKLDELTAQEDPNVTYWFEIGAHVPGFTLRATPLEIASILSEKVFAKKETVVLASATLATVEQSVPVSAMFGSAWAFRKIPESSSFLPLSTFNTKPLCTSPSRFPCPATLDSATPWRKRLSKS